MQKLNLRLLLCGICLFLLGNIAFADGNTAIVSKEIPIKTDPGDKRTNHPRKPERIPLKVYLMGDCITVTCEYETLGSVVVNDNYNGSTVASDCGDLSGGLSLILDDYHEGSMEIQITTDTNTYYGYF